MSTPLFFKKSIIMANPNSNLPYNGEPFNFNPENWMNEWLFHSQDNYVNGGALHQSLMPGEAQYSEWSQQMVSTMYQNWYNSAPEQMKRAMEAGINPFIAASGIAGSDAGNVASAPNHVQSQAPELLNAAGSLFGSAASGFNSVVQGIATAAKLRGEVHKIDAETESIFEGLGFTKLQSKALGIQLKYLDKREAIGVYQALADLDKTRQEYSNLYATHRNIMAQYEEILANKDLLIAQKGEVTAKQELENAQKLLTDEQTKWAQIENDFFAAHHYKLGSPVYESIRDMVVQGVDFDAETYGNTIADYESRVAGAVEDAKLSAQENHIYAIEYARNNGKNASDELYGRIGSPQDLAGRIAKMGTDLIKNVASDASNLFKSGKAKDIRNELNMILNNAYEQLDKYPEDEQRLAPIIKDITAALTLSNKELVEWYQKSYK